MTFEPGKATLLEVRSLSHSVPGKMLFRDISLLVNAGEIVSLRGPSGCGKSSLLRCISRLDAVDSGEIRLSGTSAPVIPVLTWRRRVAHLFQASLPLPGSLSDNLRYGPSLAGRQLDDSEILELLASVGLVAKADQDASTLSGGEAQRLGLARILANRPEVLLLDEPTSALDESSRERIEACVTESVKATGLACLWVTHDPLQAGRVAKRHLYMDAGHFAAEDAS